MIAGLVGPARSPEGDEGSAALSREIDRLRLELAEIGARARAIEQRREALQAGLRVPAAKLARDVIGAGAGIVLAPPTFGVSLQVTFWASCSLLVDRLEVSPVAGDLYSALGEVRRLRLRQSEIGAALAEIEKRVQQR